MATELSLILCARNDGYMGNALWRLGTALNCVAEEAGALGILDRIEVLVVDWASEVPLSRAVALGAAGRTITRFLYVPLATARGAQKDSPLPEVIALNVAARRARGVFIGRIDQDTVVGASFLTWPQGLLARVWRL